MDCVCSIVSDSLRPHELQSDSSVCGISQARILEQLPFPTVGDRPYSGIKTAFQILYHWATWKAQGTVKESRLTIGMPNLHGKIPWTFFCVHRTASLLPHLSEDRLTASPTGWECLCVSMLFKKITLPLYSYLSDNFWKIHPFLNQMLLILDTFLVEKKEVNKEQVWWRVHMTYDVNNLNEVTWNLPSLY